MKSIPFLQPQVVAAWEAFSEPFEGRVPYMYLDTKFLVTTAVGCLIDSAGAARALPWRLADGTPATAAQVNEQWGKLKAERRLAKVHHKFAKEFLAKSCTFGLLTLSEEDMDRIVFERLAQSVEYMHDHYFPSFEDFPADAQLGICSMAWALGPGFPKKWTHFRKAVEQQDWLGAAATCKIKDGLNTEEKTDDNPGIVPRNKANVLCFQNAAAVVKDEANPAALIWPKTFAAVLAEDPPMPPVTEEMAPAASLPESFAGPVSVAASVVSSALRDDMKGGDSGARFGRKGNRR